MSATRALTPLLAAVLTTAACAAPSAPPAPLTKESLEQPEQLPAALQTQIVTYLEQYGRNWPSFGFHGVVLVARGDTVAVNRAFGSADLALQVPNETDTRFRLGTLSAQLVSAATMRLIDLGRLSLSTTIGAHVANFPGGDSITVEHLLTHTSGVPNFTDTDWFDANKHRPHSTEELITVVRDLSRLHESGKELTPSNSNSVLLAAVVESISGMSFEQFVATQILQPASMSETEFRASPHQQALGLQFNEQEHLDPVRGVHPGAFGAAGGYLATARDLYRLNRALTRGTVLSVASRDRMMGRDQSDGGYSWHTQTLRGHAVSGWTGLIDGFNCSVLNVVDDETIVIVLANTEVVSAAQVAHDILGMAYGAESPSYDEHREIPIPLVEQVRAAGHYVVTKKTERLLESVDPEQLERLTNISVQIRGDYLSFEVPEFGAKRMHPLGVDHFFFKDIPRTTARFSQRSDGTGRLVVTQPNGVELSYIRTKSLTPPTEIASR